MRYRRMTKRQKEEFVADIIAANQRMALLCGLDEEEAPMEHKQVESKLIRSFKYDEMTEVLEVRFNSGKLYQYTGVPEKVFLDFERAKSLGGHFLAHIKPNYTCQRIEEKEKDNAEAPAPQAQE
jgi:hypothetical protein